MKDDTLTQEIVWHFEPDKWKRVFLFVGIGPFRKAMTGINDNHYKCYTKGNYILVVHELRHGILHMQYICLANNAINIHGNGTYIQE